MGRPIIDLTGQRFGRLIVVKLYGQVKPCGETLWLCKCDCGNEKVIRQGSLRNISKPTRSCGCLAKETSSRVNSKHHAMNTPLYKIWHGMKARCYTKTSGGYENYGGKGIKVCDEWRNDFLKFKEWAYSNGYKEGLSIERIDNNKDYEPSNCKWIEIKRQAKNRTTNRYITINGETKYMSEWCKIYGINISTLRQRIMKNKPKSEWFLPAKQYKKRKEGLSSGTVENRRHDKQYREENIITACQNP